jgi:hypothetical protein
MADVKLTAKQEAFAQGIADGLGKQTLIAPLMTLGT